MTLLIKKIFLTAFLLVIGTLLSGLLFAANPQDLQALQLRVKRLNNELAALQPNDPDYDRLFLTISDELRQTEAKLLSYDPAAADPTISAKNTTPNSPSTVDPTAIKAPANLPIKPSAALPANTAINLPVSESTTTPQANPAVQINPPVATTSENKPASETAPLAPVKDNSTENFSAPPLPPANSNFLGTLQNSPGNANILQHMKTELTNQLRQIQQILRTLQPEDQSLAITLKDQQTEITKELTEINRQLEQTGPGKPKKDPILQGLIGATSKQLDLQGAPPAGQQIPEAIPPTNPSVSGTSGNIAPRTPEQIAGQAVKANAALNAGPAWNEQTERNTSPYDVLTSEDVKQLKSELSALKANMKDITESIKNIEAQLKILTRQATNTPTGENKTSAPEK